MKPAYDSTIPQPAVRPRALTSKRQPPAPQSINPLQTLCNPSLERPPPNSSLERWCNPYWPLSAINPPSIPTNHILDWKKTEYEKDGGGYLDKNGNIKYFLEGYRIGAASVTWLCRFPEIFYGPEYDVYESDLLSPLEYEEMEREYHKALTQNPLVSMYPLLNGEPQMFPPHIRYGRKCHFYATVDVLCDDNEIQNKSSATPAIISTPLTSAHSMNPVSQQKRKRQRVSIVSRSFRLADHSLVCSWCLTSFEGSQANAEKHMRDFHGHQVQVLDGPLSPQDALFQDRERQDTFRSNPRHSYKQNQQQKRYACPWPFDDECFLQAQKKTLGSMDEMVRHMAGAHIGETFFCHLCFLCCWDMKDVLEHPKYCRALSGVRLRELQNRQWDQARGTWNGGTKFK